MKKAYFSGGKTVVLVEYNLGGFHWELSFPKFIDVYS